MGDVTTTFDNLTQLPKSMIFSYLSASDLRNALAVNKEWYEIITKRLLNDPAYVRPLLVELCGKINPQQLKETYDNKTAIYEKQVAKLEELSKTYGDKIDIYEKQVDDIMQRMAFGVPSDEIAIGTIPRELFSIIKCNIATVKEAICDIGIPIEIVLQLPDFIACQFALLKKLVDGKIVDSYDKGIEIVKRFSLAQSRAIHDNSIPLKIVSKIPIDFSSEQICVLQALVREKIVDNDNYDQGIEIAKHLSESHCLAISFYRIPCKIALKLPITFFDHHAVSHEVGDYRLLMLKKLANEKIANNYGEILENYDGILENYDGILESYDESLKIVECLTEDQCYAMYFYHFPFEIAVNLPITFIGDHFALLKKLVDGKIVDSYDKGIEIVKRFSSAQICAIYNASIPLKIVSKIPIDFSREQIYALQKLVEEKIVNNYDEGIEMVKGSDIASLFRLIESRMNGKQASSNVYLIRFRSVPSASIISEPNTSSNQSCCVNIDPPNTSKSTM